MRRENKYTTKERRAIKYFINSVSSISRTYKEEIRKFKKCNKIESFSENLATVDSTNKFGSTNTSKIPSLTGFGLLVVSKTADVGYALVITTKLASNFPIKEEK